MTTSPFFIDLQTNKLESLLEQLPPILSSPLRSAVTEEAMKPSEIFHTLTDQHATTNQLATVLASIDFYAKLCASETEHKHPNHPVQSICQDHITQHGPILALAAIQRLPTIETNLTLAMSILTQWIYSAYPTKAIILTYILREMATDPDIWTYIAEWFTSENRDAENLARKINNLLHVTQTAENTDNEE